MKKVIWLSIMLLITQYVFADEKRDMIPREKRGFGIYYRQALVDATINNVEHKNAQINMIAFDLFAYDLTEKKFIAGLQINYGVKNKLVEVYGFDVLVGKKFTILPYILHGQIKAGPSILHVNYDMQYRKIWTGNLGAVASAALRFTPFRGTSFMLAWEVRGISPASLSYEGDIEKYYLKFNNSVPASLKKFSFKMPVLSGGIQCGIVLDF